MRRIEKEVINTAKQIGDLVDWLILRHEPPELLYKPTIYIDLEGVDLCREGSLSILTLLLDTETPSLRVCLVDVYSLGSQAFNTPGIRKKTLKDVLGNEKIPKVFFDVRNDSDALFAHFGVALQGVQDLQLMESARRSTTRSRRYLNGLAKCVEDPVPYKNEAKSWKLAKEKGSRLFKAEYGGSPEIFQSPPLPRRYHLVLFRWETVRWRDFVDEETKKRVAESQDPGYQPHGPDRALAPWSEDQNKTLDEWNYVPPPGDYFDDEYFNDDYANDDWDDGRDDNDFEDWTRADWQGPPS